MKLCVVIPTFNEEKTITDLIRRIRLVGLNVVIIDDGSLDGTYNAVKNFGSEVVLIKNPVNLGKGASLLKGFQFALDNGYDGVITMDGDGQHDPQDIPFFTRLAQYSDSAVIIGNRMAKTKNMPLLRLLTNKFMSWLISMVAKQKIPDTQCGFRLIKSNVLKSVTLNTGKFETESEILIRAARLGFRIESVPINTIYAGEKSSINPFLDTIRFIRFILKELFRTK